MAALERERKRTRALVLVALDFKPKTIWRLTDDTKLPYEIVVDVLCSLKSAGHARLIEGQGWKCGCTPDFPQQRRVAREILEGKDDETISNQLYQELIKYPLNNSLCLDSWMIKNAKEYGAAATVECWWHFRMTPSELARQSHRRGRV